MASNQELQPPGSSGAEEENKIIEELYASAYSGDWTKEGKKFFQMSLQERMRHKLSQLVALNIAAMVSKWNFIADMLAQMDASERSAVLTSPDDVKWVRDKMVEYLSRRSGKDFSNTKKRLDGSPESLLLAAAVLGQLGATYTIATHIYIRDPDWSGPLLYQIISAGFYGVALLLCKRYPTLSVAPIYMTKVEGLTKMVTRHNTWGGRGDLDVSIADENGDDEKADNGKAPKISEIPIATELKSRSTILQVLATRRPAFRSCSRHGGGLLRSLVTWVLHLQRIDHEKPDFMTRVKNVILAVLLHFLLPFWIILEQTATIFAKLREEEERHQFAEQLLDIIHKQILINKSAYFQELRVVIKTAANKGILEIVKMCLDIFPSLIWEQDDELQLNTWVLFQSCDDIMLLAAKPPLEHTLEYVTGSALQVQRELHWFEEVENVAFAMNYEKAINSKDDAHSKFVENRKTLVQKGEEWMKCTATSCSVVAALIVTVVYQAVFQIPGGTDEKKGGTANLLDEAKKTEFIVFATSDVVSLFFSSTSLLMFLAILTSRFSAKDFKHVLPSRLILAAAALFIGLAAMMTSFTATMLIVLGSEMNLLKYITFGAVALPVTLVAILQLPLVYAVVKSTYFGRRIFKHKAKGLPFWGSLLAIYLRNTCARC
uniref:PGG domain-containing protein n=1 Tax=Kalanchoe fedtschenkoi TaxID=63787 RepID=A0A7N0TRI1_KALFE